MQSNSIVISGFGGQGIVAAGRAIAYAGMKDQKNVSMLPSYGPEMRGGSANCHVIISDSKIACPVINEADIALLMSSPALDKFEDKVKSAGTLIIDSYVIRKKPTRKDIDIIEIPATEIAQEIGNVKFSNIVMIGAMMKVLKDLSLEGMVESIKALLPEGKESLIALEIKALNAGTNYR